eukprot:GEMP01093250.1.p1 GENE.GEMP01093250.1~~GEMP01093250.1.p1  ORF type:complete len:194 (+),score=48.82 GEMP01093250.1:101-682(+)
MLPAAVRNLLMPDRTSDGPLAKLGISDLSLHSCSHPTSSSSAEAPPVEAISWMHEELDRKQEQSAAGEIGQIWRKRCIYVEQQLKEARERIERLEDEGKELRQINTQQIEYINRQASVESAQLSDQVDALSAIKVALYSKLKEAESNLDDALRDNNSDERKCCLCMETLASVVFFHCRHLCTCKTCSTRVHEY